MGEISGVFAPPRGQHRAPMLQRHFRRPWTSRPGVSCRVPPTASLADLRRVGARSGDVARPPIGSAAAVPFRSVAAPFAVRGSGSPLLLSREGERRTSRRVIAGCSEIAGSGAHAAACGPDRLPRQVPNAPDSAAELAAAKPGSLAIKMSPMRSRASKRECNRRAAAEATPGVRRLLPDTHYRVYRRLSQPSAAPAPIG
jgi:hypothetical protein